MIGLGNGAGVALGAQAPLLYALQMLQLSGRWRMGAMRSAPGGARRCGGRAGAGAGTVRRCLMLVLVLLLLLLMMVMVVLVVQRCTGPIVANLLRQRLPAATQRRTQVVRNLGLGQQLLEYLPITKHLELLTTPPTELPTGLPGSARGQHLPVLCSHCWPPMPPQSRFPNRQLPPIRLSHIPPATEQ